MFQKNSGSEEVWQRGGGGVGKSQDFLREVFCLTVLKNSVGWKYSVCHSFPAAKSFAKNRRRRGKNQEVTSKTFVSHC